MLKQTLINILAQFESENFEKNYPLDYCIPVYHCVSEENLPHLKHIVKYKSSKQFEEDLDCFSRNFQWVNFEEFKDFVKGNFKPKKKIALLTFDDGFREFYDVVIPILERKGIYAMNFVNPAFIDNKDLMYRCKVSLLKDRFNFLQFDENSVLKLKYQETKTIESLSRQFEVDFADYIEEKKPYLTSEQLKKIQEKGFGISSHGWNHPLYHEISLKEKLEDFQKAYQYLKEGNFDYESFAFPFTDFGVETDFFNEVFKNEDIFCLFGTAGAKLDSESRLFHRVPMEMGENAETILKKEIAYFRLKKYINKNYVQRK